MAALWDRSKQRMEVRLNGKVLELVQGNIVEQKGIDVVVNAADAELRAGGGLPYVKIG